MDAVQGKGTRMVIELGGISRYLALNREAGTTYAVRGVCIVPTRGQPGKVKLLKQILKKPVKHGKQLYKRGSREKSSVHLSSHISTSTHAYFPLRSDPPPAKGRCSL